MSPSGTLTLPPPLVALTPGRLRSAGGSAAGFGTSHPAAGWLRGLEQALDRGLPGVLVREPGLLDGDLLDLLLRVRELCDRDKTWMGLHDRAHLVGASGAQGLHLGFRSLSPKEARRVLGPLVPLGLSTHLGDDPGLRAECSWRSYGPIYPTPSKAGILEPVGLAQLTLEATASETPLWALGGIDPARTPEVLEAGVRGIMALGSLLGSADPGRATQEFLRAMGSEL